jgi:hypothetical protein
MSPKATSRKISTPKVVIQTSARDTGLTRKRVENIERWFISRNSRKEARKFLKTCRHLK